MAPYSRESLGRVVGGDQLCILGLIGGVAEWFTFFLTKKSGDDGFLLRLRLLKECRRPDAFPCYMVVRGKRHGDLLDVPGHLLWVNIEPPLWFRNEPGRSHNDGLDGHGCGDLDLGFLHWGLAMMSELIFNF